MIIRCPECSTGFRLPDAQVTPKGVKLRCSRCSHVFRVRSDADGEVEIFYRAGDNGESSEAETSSAASSPFPHAGLDLKPKKSSAFGDLGGDTDEEMQAFDDAFGDDEALEMEEISEGEEEEEEVSEFAPPAAALKPPVSQPEAEDEQELDEQSTSGEEAESEQESSEDLGSEESDEDEVIREADEEEKPAPLKARGGGSFGDASEFVDDSFGEDVAQIDPETGKVEEAKPKPKKSSGPRPGVAAAGPPPTQQPRVKPAERPAPAKAAPVRSTDWDEDDLAPHKIGGGPGMKIVTVLLLLSLVVMGFMGVVAARNDGFIDFRAFPQMLEVAFSDGEYEPRPEWAPQRAATVVRAPQEPLIVEAVHGELVTIGRDDHLFIAKGMVRNNDERSFRDLQLRGMITSPEGRVLRQAAAPVGQNTPISEFRALGNVADAGGLLGPGAAEMAAGDLVPFTMIFSEVPQTVIDGDNFLLRVEVANGPGADSAPVAAQE